MLISLFTEWSYAEQTPYPFWKCFQGALIAHTLGFACQSTPYVALIKSIILTCISHRPKLIISSNIFSHETSIGFKNLLLDIFILY